MAWPTAALHVSTLTLLITIAGGLFALMLTAGLIAGQFRRGVVQELRASLETAGQEIAINRSTVERLEQTVRHLEARLRELETTNEALTEAIRNGVYLAPLIKDEFAAFERRVLERHLLLAQMLPEPVKSALSTAIKPLEGAT